MRNGFARVRRGLLVIGLASLPWLLASGCGSDDEKPRPLDPSAGGTSSTRPDAQGGTGGSAADASTDAPGDTSIDGDATGGGDAQPDSPANCGDEVVCRGHSKCLLVGHSLACVCDAGYKLEGDTCVVDESCIKIRHLEDGCRLLAGGAPAVASFFAVDYCSGTAVLPDKLGGLANLSTTFKVLENGAPLGSESFATFIQRDVENYLTIAIDVSDSLRSKTGLLQQLTTELQTFVRSLTVPAGKVPVGVSVLVFGRFVQEYVPFTTNLEAVATKLQQLPTATNLPSGAGTALYEGTKGAIRATERMQRLRAAVTDGGVLSTGVAVIVTDGKESTNGTLDTTLIKDTRVNVISIGISSDIDDADLTAIGRDGSFLTPLPADMTQAFAEITQRVKEAPERAYLMGYCSSATTGTPTVEVTLNGRTVQQTAGCTFNASYFGSAGPACNADFFASFCSGSQCGEFLACGGCLDNQCCANGRCVGPSAVASDCRLQDELCQQVGQVCVKEGTADPKCVTPQLLGAACSLNSPTGPLRCDPGSGYCEATDGGSPVCTATFADGARCATATGQPRAEVCPALNCSRVNPSSLAEPHICRPQARMFDLCSGAAAAAVCESGSGCRSGSCQPRYPFAYCTSNLECASGFCDTIAKICLDTPTCYFSWDEKMQF